MTEQSIGDILSGEPEASIEEPVAETTEAQPETAERPRGPDGKFISKGDTDPAQPEAEAPPAPQEDTGHIPIAALKDERSKRQTLENELTQLRQQMAQLQQPQAQQQETQGPPDRWEDPEGYDQWLVNQATQIAREQAVHAVTQQRIYTSAVRARSKYADYDQAHQVFGEMAQRNPALFDSLMSADDPAEFAYQEAKSEMAIRQAGGLQQYIQQEAARLAAEQAPAPNLADVRSQLPPSISSDRSVGGRSGPAWSGPTPISDILR